MLSQRLVVRGGICVVILNIILLTVLVVVAVLQIPSKERKEHLNVHKCAGAVKQELRTLERSSESTQTEITRVTADLAEFYKREGNLKKPAIHLVFSQSINNPGDLPVLTWQTLPMITLGAFGVRYQEGAVTVTHGGYYFIYSNIRYVGNGTEELDFGRILHSVVMRKESETSESPTVLMRNLQSTPTIRRGREAYTTSSLGGTFYLPDKARIMVTSSIPNNIDRSPYGSYFGLFLV